MKHFFHLISHQIKALFSRPFILIFLLFAATILPVIYYPAANKQLGGNSILLSCFYKYYIGLICCTIGFTITYLLCRKRGITPIVQAKTLYLLYGTEVAYFAIFSYHLKGLPMLPDTLLFLSSFVLITGALCRKLATVLLFFITLILTFIFMVESPYTSMSPDLMMEILATSWEDARPYLTIINILLTLGLFALAFLIPFTFFRIIRSERRSTLLSCGFLHALLFIIAIQPLKYRKAIEIPYVWPIGSLASLGQSIHSANKVINNIKDFTLICKDLPEPQASSPIVKKDDGIIVILHIGESVRADHLSINGYKKNTTPHLQQEERLINFQNCLSSYCCTDRALLILLTDIANNETNGRFSGKSGSLMDYFAASQFSCASFWSNGIFTNCGIYALMKEEALFFSRMADKIYETEGKPMQQLEDIHQFLNEHQGANICLLVNNYGSHVPYDNYNEEAPPFTPANKLTPPGIRPGEEQKVLNAYDSTIHYTDAYIHRLLSSLKGTPFVYLYVSDHGEYLGDQGMWGRGTVNDTNYHSTTGALVPFFIITSPEFEALSPHFAQALETLNKNKDKRVSHAHFFHTVLGLFDIKPDVYDRRYDLTQPDCLPYTGEWPDTPTAAPAK